MICKRLHGMVHCGMGDVWAVLQVSLQAAATPAAMHLQPVLYPCVLAGRCRKAWVAPAPRHWDLWNFNQTPGGAWWIGPGLTFGESGPLIDLEVPSRTRKIGTREQSGAMTQHCSRRCMLNRGLVQGSAEAAYAPLQANARHRLFAFVLVTCRASHARLLPEEALEHTAAHKH